MSNKYFLYQNSSQTLQFNITTSTIVDGEIIETDFDLSGYSFLMRIKNRITDADDDAVISKEVTIDNTTKTATINLTPADTDIAVGTYHLGTRYHLDANNSIEGESYTIEIRRATTEIPAT